MQSPFLVIFIALINFYYTFCGFSCTTHPHLLGFLDEYGLKLITKNNEKKTHDLLVSSNSVHRPYFSMKSTTLYKMVAFTT
ncbi:hypothetical protein HMPREF9431_00011 [Segatella oulorum F0390]|uniref:Uncharacterized protein n=1 Tax=Segatella oulorum F0390 TaxID=702438 RepID=G1W860_9BACT|nr:hypothetical protein HMPREF9431_00011 [Segatella oulorum F0390]